MKRPEFLLSPFVRAGRPVRSRGTNGGANRLYPEDRAPHDWYRFVLSFPPQLVRQYLQRFKLTGDNCVLDPFCGTGTTVVECKKRGIPSIGVEANPMAFFATQVKTDWTVDPRGLSRHANRVGAIVLEKLRSWGMDDEGTLALFAEPETTRARALLSLPHEAHKLLLAGSISPIPLHKTLVLLSQLNEHQDPRYHRYELLALAKALVTRIGNLHFGPEVGVGPAKEDAPVVGAWLGVVESMVRDLPELQPYKGVPTTIHHFDSRRILEILHPNSIDAVITSPPYPNEKDYTRTTRLESVILGFIRNKAELQAFKKTFVRSNTRSVYKEDDDHTWVSSYPEIDRLAKEIEARRIAMGKTSGFERMYARVTKLYFGGMARHLAQLRAVLRPGAHLAYVVGEQASYLRILIPTGRLIGAIAQDLGYKLVAIDLFRTRLATATRQQLREEVVVLRWPG